MWPLLRILLSVFAVAASSAIALSRADLPPGFWSTKPALVLVAIIWVAAWSVIDAGQRAITEYRAKKRAQCERRRRSAEKVLKGLLVQIDKRTEAHWTEIGLHAFFVHRSLRIKGWPSRWFPLVQCREVRLRMKDYPPPTHIYFERGKGVIGCCWDEKNKGKVVAVDLSAEYRPYQNITREEWDALPTYTRFGLTFDDFTRTRDHASAILAAAMRTETNGTYLGCVSLDAPSQYFPQLNTDEIKYLLQNAADIIMIATET